MVHNILYVNKVYKNQIYKSLRMLTAKALVTKEGIKFSAIPFEEALEQSIERKKQQTQSVQESIEKLLVNWKKEE